MRGDKTVNTVTRLGVSVMCSMDLALYPHDTQVGPGSSRIEWFLELQPSRAFSWLTASSRAFSWLKAPSSAFKFKTLLRHYAKM